MARPIDLTWYPSEPDLSLEADLWRAGIYRVAGLDEAGRGAIAGPVAVGALILPPDTTLKQKLAGVRDSKELTPQQRAEWAERLKAIALAWAVGFASNQEIDELGIVPATRLAAMRAIASLTEQAQYLLLDWLLLPESPLPQTALVKGDARSLTIAGASILAKTARDALMVQLDVEYPGYGFAIHKGYGTFQHLKALECLGPSSLHRLSFRPICNPSNSAGERHEFRKPHTGEYLHTGE
jgi:ribonuclease HII